VCIRKIMGDRETKNYKILIFVCLPLPPVCTYIDPSLVKNLTYDMVTLCGMMAFNSQKWPTATRVQPQPVNIHGEA